MTSTTEDHGTDISDDDDDTNDYSHSEDTENLKNLLLCGGIDIQVESIEFFAGSSSGDNYMSVVKRILVTGRDPADENYGMAIVLDFKVVHIRFCCCFCLCVSLCSKKCKVKNISFIKSCVFSMHAQDMRALKYAIYFSLTMAMLLLFLLFFLYSFITFFQCFCFDYELVGFRGVVSGF